MPFWFLWDVIKGAGELVWNVAGETTSVVLWDKAWKIVSEAISDTAWDIWDVVQWDFTDEGDDSKWPIPKIARVILPAGTVISKALKQDENQED